MKIKGAGGSLWLRIHSFIQLDTWEGLTLVVAWLGLALFPHYSSRLKRAIDNLDNLSERPSSRGDLKRSISFL